MLGGSNLAKGIIMKGSGKRIWGRERDTLWKAEAVCLEVTPANK